MALLTEIAVLDLPKDSSESGQHPSKKSTPPPCTTAALVNRTCPKHSSGAFRETEGRGRKNCFYPLCRFPFQNQDHFKSRLALPRTAFVFSLSLNERTKCACPAVFPNLVCFAFPQYGGWPWLSVWQITGQKFCWASVSKHSFHGVADWVRTNSTSQQTRGLDGTRVKGRRACMDSCSALPERKVLLPGHAGTRAHILQPLNMGLF